MTTLHPESQSTTESFLIDFHSKNPSCTSSVFADGKTDSGKSSYELLTDIVPKTSAIPLSIVDLACGDGYLLEKFATWNDLTLKLTGVDMSDGELRVARKRLSSFLISLHEAKAQSLPIENQSADYILCHMAFMLMTETEQVVTEIHRVLKSGGTFSAIIGGPGEKSIVFDRFIELLDEGLKSEGKIWMSRLGDKRVRASDGIQSLFQNGFQQPIKICDHLLRFSLPVPNAVQFFMLMYDVALLSEKGQETLRKKLNESFVDFLNSNKCVDFTMGVRQITVQSERIAFTQPALETDRLSLEPITENHAQEIFELFADSNLHTFVPQDPPTLEQAKEKCLRWSKRKSPDGKELWLNWAGRHKQTGKIVAHFQAGVKDDKVATIGYLVEQKFQNQGFATEGLQKVFQYLHQNLGAKEVKAWSDTRNTASHQLAKKLGMIQVEIIKNADFFKGSSSDEFVFSKVFDHPIEMKSQITIRAAKSNEGDLLTDLSLRSKSYWNYPEDYLSRCRPALLVDAEYIKIWPVMVLEVNGQMAGFYSLKNIKGEDRLDNLWIDLPFIGKGYGKVMLNHAIKTAQGLGWKSFRLAADPGAEKFYEKFGANKLGMVQSRIKSDLFLPHMEFRI